MRNADAGLNIRKFIFKLFIFNYLRPEKVRSQSRYLSHCPLNFWIIWIAAHPTLDLPIRF